MSENVCIVCGRRDFSSLDPIRNWVCDECYQNVVIDTDNEWDFSAEKAGNLSKMEGLIMEKKETPFEKGKSYFIRTVTYHLVGEVVKQTGDFLELKDASWVADSGRFTQAIKDGKLDEVEPVGIAFVSVSSIVDAFPWVHALPVKQK